MGEILDGNRDQYEIVGEVGGGGMCMVYRARSSETGQMVAVKALQTNYCGSAEICSKFQRGAEVHAELSLHPNVVSLFDFFLLNSRPYVVMELVEGGTLESQLDERGLMPHQRAVPIFLQILSALEHAHRKKIVHRDIKPSNILLTHDDIPKVTDFDIGKKLGGETFTRFGQKLGTRPYMSPEQTHNTLDVTEASDIYSLGVTLYEMCTNRLPFETDDELELYQQMQHAQPIPPRDIYPFLPIQLEGIILKAMDKDPGNRFDTVEDFREALFRFVPTIKELPPNSLRGETVIDLHISEDDSFSGEESGAFGSIVQVGNQKPAIYVSKSGVRLGRGEPNTISIPEEDLRISRNHAWIVPLPMEQGRVVVVDLGSKNGTYVNGLRLDPSYRVSLIEGDVIQLGQHEDWRFLYREKTKTPLAISGDL